MSTALELHNRGYSVSVVDADRVPAELAASTDISKLVRADYGDDEFYFDLMVCCCNLQMLDPKTVW